MIHTKIIFRVLLALGLMLGAFQGAFAYTETTAGITFNGPNTYSSCVNAVTTDTVTITGVGANTLKGYVDVQYVTDTGRQEIHTYNVSQTGDLNLTVSYPPVSQWPALTNSIPPGTREIHVDVSITATDPNGNFLALFDGLLGGANMGWDVFCLASAPPPANLCTGIFSPGYWKNYQNHYTQAQFYALLTQTKDFGPIFAGMTQTNAINLAETILQLKGYYDDRSLLAAELNVAAMPALGTGLFTPSGASQASTVNALLTTAFVDDNSGTNVPLNIFTNSSNVTGADQDVLSYLSGGGENVSSAICRVQ